jgi:hypothetical protein
MIWMNLRRLLARASAGAGGPTGTSPFSQARPAKAGGIVSHANHQAHVTAFTRSGLQYDFASGDLALAEETVGLVGALQGEVLDQHLDLSRLGETDHFHELADEAQVGVRRLGHGKCPPVRR